MERRLVCDYLRLVERILPSLSDLNYETAVALANLPQEMSGFGPVKAGRIDAAKAKEIELMASFERVDQIMVPEEASWAIAAE